MENTRNKADYLMTDIMQRDLFTYVVDVKLPDVKILQQETDISLSLEMEKEDKTLYVTGYKLSEYPALKKFFGELYEVATLDFVLQAVKTLLSFAEEYKVNEIFFILSKEEADHFKDIGISFLPISTIMTDKGEKSSFVLFYSPLTVGAIRTKIQDIQLRLKAEFWTVKPSNPCAKTDSQVDPLPYLIVTKKAPQHVNDYTLFCSEQIH